MHQDITKLIKILGGPAKADTVMIGRPLAVLGSQVGDTRLSGVPPMAEWYRSVL